MSYVELVVQPALQQRAVPKQHGRAAGPRGGGAQVAEGVLLCRIVVVDSEPLDVSRRHFAVHSQVLSAQVVGL